MTMTTASTKARNFLEKICETTALQDEQLPSLESAITAFFENQPTGQTNSTQAPARATTRPPRSERWVSEAFMRSLVRDKVQRKVDMSCRQFQAKVDDYIGS